MAHFSPVLVLIIDIDSPLPDIKPRLNSESNNYSQAIILVRLHKQPLGVLEVEISGTGLSSDVLAKEIWVALGREIKGHLNGDGVIQPAPLDKNGYVLLLPECLRKREEAIMSFPFVSIVVATRNRIESLGECLQSLLALDYPNYEVIVVDNAPTSSLTEDFINEHYVKSGKVRYFREDVPGLGSAHNRALLEVNANSSIISFTDDDVVVDTTWLKAIVEVFQNDPQVGCVTGMILPYELETPAQRLIEEFGGFSKGYNSIVFDLDKNRPRDFLFPYSAGRFGSGANMAYRTSVLKAMGGFDPALGAGTLTKSGDDLAAFFDVVDMGYRLVYEPRAILSHKHRRDYAGLVQQTYGYGVGMAAFLMRTILEKPIRIFDILLKAPAGLRYLLDPNSSKNNKKQIGYPRELTLIELKGYLIGPLLYLQSRYKARHRK